MKQLKEMKNALFLILATTISVVSMAQSAADTKSVKKVVVDFQDDFNEGSFKMPRSMLRQNDNMLLPMEELPEAGIHL